MVWASNELELAFKTLLNFHVSLKANDGWSRRLHNLQMYAWVLSFVLLISLRTFFKNIPAYADWASITGLNLPVLLRYRWKACLLAVAEDTDGSALSKFFLVFPSIYRNLCVDFSLLSKDGCAHLGNQLSTISNHFNILLATLIFLAVLLIFFYLCDCKLLIRCMSISMSAIWFCIRLD